MSVLPSMSSDLFGVVGRALSIIRKQHGFSVPLLCA